VYVQQRSNAYLHNKSQKGGPVQILSRAWISCSPELEVWSEFKSIQDWIVLVSFEFDTVRFLGHPIVSLNAARALEGDLPAQAYTQHPMEHQGR
jgi:hypothetical protein